VLRRLLVPAAVLTAWLLATATPAPAVEPQEKMVRASYPVADLVVPTTESAKTARTGKPQPTQEDDLIRLIVQAVQPATWSDNGGVGSIEYMRPTMSLVINQTPQIQEQVADLLERLRKAQDTRVALEVRFVSVPEDAMERIGADFGTGHRLRFLNETQMLRFLEAAGADKRTCVLTAPKVTAQDRQAISLKIATGPHEWTTTEPSSAKVVADVCDKGEPNETGWHMTARPVVSGDRRFVMLSLNVEQREAQTAVRKTVAVPDGGTVLLDGFRTMVQVEKECPQPVIGDIPYLNRLFQVVCASREPRRVFVLVTPRIIVSQEEEEKVGPTTSGPVAVESAPATAQDTKRTEPSSRQAAVLAELLRAYDAACTEGRGDEAEKFARAALILDPTCFRRNR